MVRHNTSSMLPSALIFGCDHGGYALKQNLLSAVKEKFPSLRIADVGCFSETSCDYPDIAAKICDAILATEGARGVAICGTGIGISIACNRYRGIRCALCHDSTTAQLSRQHNDANVLALGGRVVGIAVAVDALLAFISSSFDGGRHVRRILRIEQHFSTVTSKSSPKSDISANSQSPGSMHLPVLGAPVESVDTPALVVEMGALEHNIRALAQLCCANGKAWRPHSKGHKSPAIAKLQMDAGAIGVTCAKLGEAEIMAAAGITDILIANQIGLNSIKLGRLAALRLRGADPIVTVDSTRQAEAISAVCHSHGVVVRAIIEIDIGMNRAGVQPPPLSHEPGADSCACVVLAQRVASDDLPGIKFVGIMGYEGHALIEPDAQKKKAAICGSLACLARAQNAIERAGLRVDIVSAGGTGSMHTTATVACVTELQAGGGTFCDVLIAGRERGMAVDGLRFALTVHTTVTSRPTLDRAIVDAGRKSLAHWEPFDMPAVLAPVSQTMEKEQHESEQSFSNDLKYTMLCAEHGVLSVDTHTDKNGLDIGTRLQVVPAYHDLTTVLHDRFIAVRNGRVHAIWPLLGRGRLD
eukprot:g1719.t1